MTCRPPEAAPPPALSQLVAVTAQCLGTTPQVAAFWLPPFLAGLLPLTVFVWGRRFYGDPAALAPALGKALDGQKDVTAKVKVYSTYSSDKMAAAREAPAPRPPARPSF